MSCVTLATAAAAAALPAPANPHPGHGPIVIAIGGFKFDPATVNVVQGDPVLFYWKGPDTNHSATSDDGAPMAFDSDQGKAPGQVSHKVQDGWSVAMTTPGTYGFHCKVHPSMRGTINVAPYVQPAPAPPPKVTRLKASPMRLCSRRSHRCTHPGTLLSITLDNPADVQVRIARRAGGATLEEVDFGAPPGTTRKRVSFGSLKPGAYRITVVAVDTATGASGKPARINVQVRR